MADHSDMAMKLACRMHASRMACTWVPFCGRGVVARAVDYPLVHACDISADCVRSFRARVPAQRVLKCRADEFPFGTEIYGHFDIDAWGTPYGALEHAIRHARTTETFTVAVTDGTRRIRERTRSHYVWANHSFENGQPMRAWSQSRSWDAEVMAFLKSAGVNAEIKYSNSFKWMRYMMFECSRIAHGAQSDKFLTEWGLNAMADDA